MALPGAFIIALLTLGFLHVRQHPVLLRAFLGAAAALSVWAALLFASVRRDNRTLALEVMIRSQHWMQACAQGTVLLYWGWHNRFVYAFLPLIVAQLLFAYAVDALLSWSRRDTYTLGFGPFPIVFSINLFLWFRPEWFHWQFVMVAVGYAAKEFIRWNREGRPSHVFNPSSFPLAVAALALLVSGASHITLGFAIAQTQFDTPHIYLLIFLVALPGQLLFGVARMTVAAVVTMYLISVAYFGVTGTYLFYDSHIPVPVFLGMHLLFTDPSTSPRSELGRIVFGMLYAIGIIAFFVLLSALGLPTFYDKLLPVPILNLLVRRIDRIAASRTLAALDPSRTAASLTPKQRNAGYAMLWAGVFVVLSAFRGVGNSHPGQYLPFWQRSCATGSARACAYQRNLTLAYCNNGSGWACNEVGFLRVARREPAADAFTRGCELGFAPACQNVEAVAAGAAPVARAGPATRDLPIVLRGTKPPLRERDPAKLSAIGCEQGWPGMCERSLDNKP